MTTYNKLDYRTNAYYECGCQYTDNEEFQKIPDYRTNAYYECFGEYAYVPKEETKNNNEEEHKDDYLICDVSCNDIYNCI